MGLQAVPGYIGIAGYNHPANLLRNFNAGIAGRRSGAFRYNDFALTPSAVNMSCLINSGEAVLVGNEDSAQGGYYAWSNLPETIAWPAAGGTPRYDTLLLRVVDTTYGSDPSTSGAFWDVVSGTPSGSPVPVTDADLNVGGPLNRHGAYLRIADFLVGASITNLAAATLVHRRKYARLGRHTMGLTVDLPSDAQVGDSFTYLDGALNGRTVRYNGAAWEADSIGPWTNYSPTLWNNAASGTPASIARTVNHAQYKIVGDMCFFEFDVTANAAAANGAAVTMPVTSPQRWQNCGSGVIHGGTVSATQSGVAYMIGSGPYDKIVCVSNAPAFLSMASGEVMRVHGFYKI